MNDLDIWSALSSGLIAGLLIAGVAPAYNLLLGLGVGAGFAAVVLLARALAVPEEDTEPEVRPPTHRGRRAALLPGNEEI